MRTLYLIRHGAPAFPGGNRVCLSRTDLPLSVTGRLQGVLLGAFLPAFPAGSLFTSPLLRARETASFIGEAVEKDALTELGVGAWEGLPFSVIKEEYPALYAARGSDPYHTLIPGAEAPVDCKRRMRRCMDALLSGTRGDIAVVSHAGAIRLYLCALRILPERDFLTFPLPCGSVTRLVWDRGVITAADIGTLPEPALTRELCLKLLEAAGTPANVIRHSLAVEEQALRLAGDRPVDRALLSRAALLHDMLRTEPFHEKAAAGVMEELGYADVAAVIRTHTELPEALQNSVTESSLLFLADKTVSGEKAVSLSARFSLTREKCGTPEALRAHARRFAQAERIMQLLEEGT